MYIKCICVSNIYIFRNRGSLKYQEQKYCKTFSMNFLVFYYYTLPPVPIYINCSITRYISRFHLRSKNLTQFQIVKLMHISINNKHHTLSA